MTGQSIMMSYYSGKDLNNMHSAIIHKVKKEHKEQGRRLSILDSGWNIRISSTKEVCLVSRWVDEDGRLFEYVTAI